MTYVIGIASIPGGGKTSLTKSLTNALGNATSIHLDTYENITSKSIDEIKRWMERGADFNEFKIPRLVEDLYKLKNGESIINPQTNNKEDSQDYIIFETNYGREHHDTSQYIDLLVWIDTPLDLALARTLKSITSMVMQQHQTNSVEQLAWLDSYLDNYINVVRNLLQMQKDRICRSADIKVDGCADLDALTVSTLKVINNKLI